MILRKRKSSFAKWRIPSQKEKFLLRRDYSFCVFSRPRGVIPFAFWKFLSNGFSFCEGILPFAFLGPPRGVIPFAFWKIPFERNSFCRQIPFAGIPFPLGRIPFLCGGKESSPPPWLKRANALGRPNPLGCPNPLKQASKQASKLSEPDSQPLMY